MLGRGGRTILGAAALLVTVSVAGAETPTRGTSTPLLVHESSVVVQSDEREASRQIQDLIRRAGGQLVRATDSEVVVDLPTRDYARLVESLRAVGHVSSERLSTRDVGAELARAEADVRAARGRISRIEGLAGKAVDVQERLRIEQEARRATQAEASARSTERILRRRATLTRVTLHLEQPPVETIATPVLPFPWLDQLGLPELLNPSSSAPEPRRVLRAFLDANLQLRLGHVADAERLGGPTKLGAALLSLRTLGEANPMGLFGGFDLSLGAGGGFLYGAQALVGVGMPFGERFAVGVSTGPGVDGISGVIPAGFLVPIELYLSLDLFRWMNAALWVRDGWVPGSDTRHEGSRSAPFGDELAAGILLGFGQRGDGHYSQDRFGPLAGFAYREQMGARIFEVRLGWGGHTSDFSETN
jgi:hypothetical protein